MVTKPDQPVLLSLAIITYNEETKLRECLKSVPFADEVVIVDSGSTDGTSSIARQFHANLSVRAFTNFADQKNAAIDRARGKWILLLDADERLTLELQSEIKELLNKSDACDAYYVRRNNFLFGGRMRFGANLGDWQLRLLRKGAGRFEGLVHERIRFNGQAGRLRGALLHYSYQTIQQYFSKFDLFSSLDAENMWKQGKKPTWAHFLIKPPMDFMRFYIFRLGILDGFRGLLYQLLATNYLYSKYRKTLNLYKERGLPHNNNNEK